jgi:hypothetical protein
MQSLCFICLISHLFLVLLIGPNGSMKITFPDISWLNDLREAIKRQCNLLNENDETANNSKFFLSFWQLSLLLLLLLLLLCVCVCVCVRKEK